MNKLNSFTESESIILEIFKKYVIFNFNEAKNRLFQKYTIIKRRSNSNPEIRQYYPSLEALNGTSFWLKRLSKDGYLIHVKFKNRARCEPSCFYFLSKKAFNEFNFSIKWISYRKYMKKVSGILW